MVLLNVPTICTKQINFFTSLSERIFLQLSHSAPTTITARLQVLCNVWLDHEGFKYFKTFVALGGSVARLVVRWQKTAMILQQPANLSFSLYRLHRNGIFIQCERGINRWTIYNLIHKNSSSFTQIQVLNTSQCFYKSIFQSINKHVPYYF